MYAKNDLTTTTTKRPRRLVVLDLDENIVSIQLSSSDRPLLSRSAKQDLSSSTEGIVEEPVLYVDQTNRVSAHRATAFRRKEWKKFFEDSIVVNQRYQELTGDPIPLISFMCLTNATYTHNEFINNVFRKFFGDKITDTLLPESNQYVNEQGQLSILPEKDKGAYLDRVYSSLKNKYGLTSKEEVTLVDDSINNITGVRTKGFTGIHNPSNSRGRDFLTTYSTHKGKAFEELNSIVKCAEAYVDKLSKNNAEKGMVLSSQ
jgi:hypothetical protein